MGRGQQGRNTPASFSFCSLELCWSHPSVHLSWAEGRVARGTQQRAACGRRLSKDAGGWRSEAGSKQDVTDTHLSLPQLPSACFPLSSHFYKLLQTGFISSPRSIFTFRTDYHPHRRDPRGSGQLAPGRDDEYAVRPSLVENESSPRFKSRRGFVRLQLGSDKFLPR